MYYGLLSRLVTFLLDVNTLYYGLLSRLVNFLLDVNTLYYGLLSRLVTFLLDVNTLYYGLLSRLVTFLLEVGFFFLSFFLEFIYFSCLERGTMLTPHGSLQHWWCLGTRVWGFKFFLFLKEIVTI